MSSMFTPEQGFFVRTPSWHRLESTVLLDWPGDWATARAAAKLDWDPVVTPAVYSVPLGESYTREVHAEEGWNRISRSDTNATLSYQESSYRVITNTEFGGLIETVLGMDLHAELKFEGVFELYGGRMVVAMLYFDTPLQVPGDPSQTASYAVFSTRHDGQGGWRIMLTNVRVVCANTLSAAEGGARDGTSLFTIRHTANWDERTAEVREQLLKAMGRLPEYAELGAAMMATKVSLRQTSAYLTRLLPTGDDMTDRQRDNRLLERDQIKTLLNGPTCEGIAGTAWGLLQASTEWSDHYRRSASGSSYVSRQLFSREPLKEKALRLTREMV